MTAATKSHRFDLNTRVTNANGAWVELRTYQHPSNFYFVYGFRYWAPTFADDLPYAESTTHMDRNKIERQMTNWLENR